MTLPMVAGSMPCTMTPARFDALDAMTSPCDDGRRAPTTPGTRADALERRLVVAPRRLAGRVDHDVRVVAEDLALQVLAEAAHHADRRSRARTTRAPRRRSTGR